MRKTNIRINGYYIARQGNQYFKTEINIIKPGLKKYN